MFETKKKSPSELYDLRALGGKARSVQEGLQELLTQEKEFLLSMIASIKPDLADYAKIAGEISLIRKLEKTFELRIADAEAASEQLKKGT